MIFGVSCDNTEDDNQPLTVSLDGDHLNFDKDNQYLMLHLSDSDDKAEATFVIYGGDGRYSIDTDNGWSVKIEYNINKFVVTPIHQGSTVVTVKDESDNTYNITIDVVPVKQFFVCTSYSYRIEGELLTTDKRDELKDEIFAAIPKSRTYVFTYTEKDKGEVEISSETEDTKKGTFTIQNVSDCMYTDYNLSIKIDGEELLYKYNRGIPSDSFSEDVTEQYKDRFPNLESAIAMQCGHFQLRKQ